MPDGRVAGVLLPTRVTREFDFDGEVWRFRSMPTDEAIGVDASEAAQACGALYAWIGEMAEEAFDDLDTNGRRLLEAWLVLRELAQGFMREAGPADGGAPLAPFVVDRKDLESHLAVALGCAPEHAAAYLGYLQHDAMLSTELYGHPLLDLAPDRIGIFLPGLLHANLERVIVRWLRRYLNPEKASGTQDAYALKGGHFETFVRSMLKEAAEHAELRGWRIEPGAVRFEGRDGMKGREFDLLLTFGSTLIVAEIKCSSHPADPHEIWEREELIGEAVGQVRAQVDWIRGNWAKFKERVTLPLAADLEGQRIVPVVLVDGCYGAGFAVDGVPVIDGAELKGFMLSGRFNAGHDDAGVALERLYSDPAQAEAVLPAFLQQPPIIARYLASCKTRTLTYKEPGRSKERVLYKDWIVGPEPGPDAIERRLQSINDAWRERVGAKG